MILFISFDIAFTESALQGIDIESQGKKGHFRGKFSFCPSVEKCNVHVIFTYTYVL